LTAAPHIRVAEHSLLGRRGLYIKPVVRCAMFLLDPDHARVHRRRQRRTAEAGVSDLGPRSRSPRPLRKKAARLNAPSSNLPEPHQQADALIRTVCTVAGSMSFLDEIDEEIRHAGLDQAVVSGNTLAFSIGFSRRSAFRVSPTVLPGDHDLAQRPDRLATAAAHGNWRAAQ
jgi:hypothetical protein